MGKLTTVFKVSRIVLTICVLAQLSTYTYYSTDIAPQLKTDPLATRFDKADNADKNPEPENNGDGEVESNSISKVVDRNGEKASFGKEKYRSNRGKEPYSQDKGDSKPTAADPIDEYIATQTSEGSSLAILLSALKDHTRPEAYGDDIDTEEDIYAETQRCKRYGYEYNPSVKKRRRIFMGSLIADDSWHVIAAHAAEAFGLYHTVAFVESNTTQTMTARKTNFDRGSLNWKMLTNGVFGPKTDVYIDFRVDGAKDYPHLKPLIRENIQREHITKRWKAAGMQPEDVGIICDVDEIFSRDFLLALQSCDIPQFRPGQNCFRPQVTGQGLFFEGTPECQYAKYGMNGYWRHPNAILGECINRIGVDTPGLRHYMKVDGGHLLGIRDFEEDPNRTMYPPWNTWDFRRAQKDVNLALEEGHLHTAYHLHNFFDSFYAFRNKYKTYGHPVEGVDKLSLAEVDPHLGRMVRCLKKMRGKHGDYGDSEGRRPILFENEAYRIARHKEMIEGLEEDEKIYGKKFVP